MQKYVLLTLLLVSSCSHRRPENVEETNQTISRGLESAKQRFDLLDQELDQPKNQHPRLLTLRQNILQQLIRLREDFNSSKFRGRKTISSDDKEYKKYLGQRDDFKKRLQHLEKLFKAFDDQKRGLTSPLK